MEITDIPAALRMVQGFIVILERGREKRRNTPYILDYRSTISLSGCG